MATHAYSTSTHAAERAELHRIRAAFAHEIGRLNSHLDRLSGSAVATVPLVGSMAAPKLVTDVDPNDFPDEYAMVCQGTCLEPEVPDGTCLMFDKREPVCAGDLVVLYFRPELVAPGQHQGIVKRLVLDVPPWVRFPYGDHPDSNVQALITAEQTNPHRRYAIKAASLLAIHNASARFQLTA